MVPIIGMNHAKQTIDLQCNYMIKNLEIPP